MGPKSKANLVISRVIYVYDKNLISGFVLLFRLIFHSKRNPILQCPDE